MLSEFWGYFAIFILGIWDIFHNNQRCMGYWDPPPGPQQSNASRNCVLKNREPCHVAHILSREVICAT